MKFRNTERVFMKIALTGASGLVGSRIVELLNNDFEFISLSSNDFDIRNQDQVNKVLKDINFDMFLHLAAYTNVDGAEIDSTEAYAMNVKGTENIFNAVQNKGKKMIYMSTDLVFDGKNPPYDENSTENPISKYGETKYQGEQVLKDENHPTTIKLTKSTNPDWTIKTRSSFAYESTKAITERFNNSFVPKTLRALRDKSNLQKVT